MSRVAFTIGLLLSALLHAWLLRAAPPSSSSSQAPAPARATAPVVETADLAPDAPEEEAPPESATPEPPSPAEQPPPEPQPEPAPKPEEAQQIASAPEEREPSAAPSATVDPPPADPSADADPTPPQPDLADLADPEPTEPSERSGDFAGQTDAAGERPPTPELRIDWGAEDDASAVMEAGDMKLAILRAEGRQPVVVAEVHADDAGGWTRAPYQPDRRVRYSNRLRVVDDVPAFDRARQAVNLAPSERLVVLVPTRIERMLQSAQLAAAFERGLSLERVRRLGGRFNLESSELGFTITRVQIRAEGAR